MRRKKNEQEKKGRETMMKTERKNVKNEEINEKRK